MRFSPAKVEAALLEPPPQRRDEVGVVRVCDGAGPRKVGEVLLVEVVQPAGRLLAIAANSFGGVCASVAWPPDAVFERALGEIAPASAASAARVEEEGAVLRARQLPRRVRAGSLSARSIGTASRRERVEERRRRVPAVLAKPIAVFERSCWRIADPAPPPLASASKRDGARA